MLNSEGLLRYVDSRCVQRELSEAAGISEEEMDELAHELLYMRQDDAPTVAEPAYHTRGGSAAIMPRSSTYRGCPVSCWTVADGGGGGRKSDDRDAEASVAATSRSTTRPPFYEHLGGYGMHELKDYNEHSKRSSTVVARVARRLPCLGEHGGSGINGGGGGGGDTNGDGRTGVERRDRRLTCRLGQTSETSESPPGELAATTTPWIESRCEAHDLLLRRHVGSSFPARLSRTGCQRRPVNDGGDQIDETTTMYVTSL